MANEAPNRGLVIAAVVLVLSVALAFAALISESNLHRTPCPGSAQSSPSSPEGPACLHIATVQGSSY